MRIDSPLTASARLERDIPRTAGERLETIERALASLKAEEDRLLRLGLERPLARCREQQRYWRFLQGVFATAARAGTAVEDPENSWLGPRL